MAQQRSGSSGKSGRPSGGSRPGGKPGAKSAAGSGAGSGSGARPPSRKTSSGTRGSATKTAGQRPPTRKKPKSIVNQKQTPWALILTTVVVVLFAAAVVVVVIVTRPSDDPDSGAQHTSRGGQTVSSSDPYRRPEFKAAAAIKGVTYRVQGRHNHETGKIKYDQTPPTGGDHNAYWADCSGTVYDKAIANENGVHMLEHGAIWITYNASEVTGPQLAKLKTYVSGVDRMAMSPYPNLSTPISLQAWGYQLKLSNANDPRIAQFIKVLRFNQQTTPEPNATCSQPTFKASPSTFGNPKDGP